MQICLILEKKKEKHNFAKIWATKNKSACCYTNMAEGILIKTGFPNIIAYTSN